MREIQKGLFAELRTFTHGGVSYSRYDIRSGDGYCFWEKSQAENYNEKGELKPLAERVFSRFGITPYKTIEEINANFVSVPLEAEFMIS